MTHFVKLTALAAAYVAVTVSLVAIVPAAIAEDPPATVLARQALSKIDNKDWAGAIKDYDAALRLMPADARPGLSKIYCNRGYAKEQLKDFSGALADYSDCIRMNQNLPEPFYRRAGLLVEINKQDDFQRAIEDATYCIRNGYEVADSYSIRGTAYLLTNRLTNAIAEYNESIKLAPQESDTWHLRAAAKHALNDFKGAIEDSNQAIRVYSKCHWAFFTRAQSKLALKDSRGALEDANTAVSLKPTNWTFIQLRGTARRENRDYKGAQQDYEQALQMNPGNQTLLNQVATVKQLIASTASGGVAPMASATTYSGGSTGTPSIKSSSNTATKTSRTLDYAGSFKCLSSVDKYTRRGQVNISEQKDNMYQISWKFEDGKGPFESIGIKSGIYLASAFELNDSVGVSLYRTVDDLIAGPTFSAGVTDTEMEMLYKPDNLLPLLPSSGMPAVVSGTWSVSGDSGGGNQYSGVLTLTKAGPWNYRANWKLSDGRNLEGLGVVSQNMLAIAFKKNQSHGVLLYTIESAGKMQGVGRMADSKAIWENAQR